MTALVAVFEHAHSQIVKLSDARRETIEKASGSHIISELYARAGLAASQGSYELPLLASEVGLLEAAVVNLESYEGYEVVLCSGYELIAALSSRRTKNRPVRRVYGILSFVYGELGPMNSSTTPSVPGSEGPKLDH
ncbi:hypothetical protein [Streptomyces mirabilis]|uniref:hypothetical protein n=1 Tax=Streptomyces mirabilis TaxID=68239 RepID=UPI0033AD6E20